VYKTLWKCTAKYTVTVSSKFTIMYISKKFTVVNTISLKFTSVRKFNW